MKFRTGALCWRHELSGETVLVGKYFEFRFEAHRYEHHGNKDLENIIEATKKDKAQQAYELFISALTLINGHVTYPLNELPSVSSYSLKEVKQEFLSYHTNIRQFSQSGRYQAAVVATKASFRKHHTISIYKYLLHAPSILIILSILIPFIQTTKS